MNNIIVSQEKKVTDYTNIQIRNDSHERCLKEVIQLEQNPIDNKKRNINATESEPRS